MLILTVAIKLYAATGTGQHFSIDCILHSVSTEHLSNNDGLPLQITVELDAEISEAFP